MELGGRYSLAAKPRSGHILMPKLRQLLPFDRLSGIQNRDWGGELGEIKHGFFHSA
jgi:hypothetical protein